MDTVAELALWTAGSIGLWALGTHIARLAVLQPSSLVGRFRTGWSGNPVGYALQFLIRVIFYLLIPYLALVRHALSPAVIGLSGTDTGLPWWNLGWKLADWAGAMGWITGLGGIAGVTLVAGWWNAHRATLSHAGAGGEFPAGGLVPAPSILSIVPQAVFAEAHWAFYRAVPLMLVPETHWAFYRAVPLLIVPDVYWATLAGGALVIVEWVLDPAWRASIRDGSRREAALLQAGWLALSCTVFVMARNVWVMLFLHIVLAWATGRWVALLAARRTVIRGQS